MKEVWADLSSGGRKAVIGILIIFALGVASAITSCVAEAVEPGWYAPLDGSGQGIIVRCSEGGQCAANWLTYADGDQAWLISTNTCDRAASVCEFEFARTEGEWFGRGFEFSDTLVTAEIEQTADSVIVDYEAIRLLPDRCNGITPGGLLFRNCIGVDEFFLLAR